jgi:hypothetical protein
VGDGENDESVAFFLELVSDALRCFGRGLGSEERVLGLHEALGWVNLEDLAEALPLRAGADAS